MPDRSESLGVPFTEGQAFQRAYLDAVRRAGSAGTDRFGLRLMWENARDLFEEMRALFPDAGDDRAALAAAFGNLTFLHLSRTDKAAQAASLLKARTGGLWHLGADGADIERDPPLWAAGSEPDRVEDYLASLADDDAAWSAWFADQGIAPISLTYEALAADAQGCLADVLAALGLDPKRAHAVQPPTAKLPG